MSRKHYLDGEMRRLDEGWSLDVCEAGAHARPSDLPRAPNGGTPALVPGTAAAALEAAGLFDRNKPEPLIDNDIWYRRTLAGEAPGLAVLRFEGLATIAEVFLDDRLILSCESMFESHDVAVELKGTEILSICFRALRPRLERPGPRARWRPRLMNNQGLRLVRTTPLGFMPGWAPEIHAVGPWRPITLIRPRTYDLSDLCLLSRLAEDGSGLLSVRFRCDREVGTARLACGGVEAGFENCDGIWSAELRIPNVEPWWPHTHGKPSLLDVTLRVEGEEYHLARTGFRRVVLDRGTDGNDFSIEINGERIFCRGAVWTSADLIGLPADRNRYEPWLSLAKDAGMNMIRVPGIGVYESPDFFALCDELGIMVWQDLMFANFDYPASDPGFLIHVKWEVENFLRQTQTYPSLTVICGGSEIYQQGAMLGLPERIWKNPLCEELLRDLASERRSDLPYVPNSPSGGQLPFYSNSAVAHYYGVGAYKQPLEDARRANIRFAAECLAFSNLSAKDRLEGGKAGIPRDAGADWDFEDVRDHYLERLYDADTHELRQSGFEHYLALSRAVTGEVMEATFGEWRRPGSTCNGALVFTLQDVMPGPGWGLVDAEGDPKPAWHALRRAFRPIQVLFADEGNNGLDVHLLNETVETLHLTLEVMCLRDGRVPVVSGRQAVTLGPRSARSMACTDLFGAFFDTNYAFRFGPPSHNVCVAELRDAQTGTVVAEAFHFPLGRSKAIREARLTAALHQEDHGYRLEISADVLAQSIMIEAPGYRASDNAFHLRPDTVRSISLVPNGRPATPPTGWVRCLGNGIPVPF